MAARTEGAGYARSSVGRGRSARLTTETKHALKTTEFWAFVATVAGILAAAQIVSSGNGNQSGDAFKASQAWLYVAIASVGYMISRGLAKAGSREPYWADGENDNRE